MQQQQLDFAGSSGSIASTVNRRRVGEGLSLAALMVVVAAIWRVVTRPLPVGQLTTADHRSITQLVATRTGDPIREVKPRDTLVVVETLWHSYYFERTRNAWKITWESS